VQGIDLRNLPKKPTNQVLSRQVVVEAYPQMVGTKKQQQNKYMTWIPGCDRHHQNDITLYIYTGISLFSGKFII